MEKSKRNFYELLGLTRDAEQDAIKKGYRKAALEHHPDKGGTDEMFQRVKEAYDTLSDPIRKRNYDRDLKKYGYKDGLNKKKSSMNTTSSKNNFKKSTTKPFEREETKARTKTESTKSANTEIPDNLNKLTIKELKLLLKDLGLKHEDCFEKKDMVDRLQEYKDKKSGKSQSYNRSSTQAPPKPASKPSTSSKSNTQPPPQEDFSDTDEPIAFKILSVGNQEVGKSCLIKRYCEGRFVKRYIFTIGIDYGVKKMTLDGSKISINFFDLSGNDDYKLIREEFYVDTDGVLMVYDVDNRDSYISLVHWESEMRQNGLDPSQVAVVVCANKVDGRGREVSTLEGQKWCKMRGYKYFETSANNGENVNESFEALFTKVLGSFRKNQEKFGLS